MRSVPFCGAVGGPHRAHTDRRSGANARPGGGISSASPGPVISVASPRGLAGVIAGLAVWIALGLLPGGCAPKTDLDDVDRGRISAGELRPLVEAEPPRVLLLDARPASSGAGLPGAVRRGVADFPLERGRDERLLAYDQLVVYGADPGDFSAKALAQRLVALGYPRVRWYAGGVAEWRATAGGQSEVSPGEEPGP